MAKWVYENERGTFAGRLNGALMLAALAFVSGFSLLDGFTAIWHDTHPKSPAPTSPLQILGVWLASSLLCVWIVSSRDR